jgi:hypothetical protein
MFILAASTTMGAFGIQSASADCTVSLDALGADCTGGNCTVNVTTCHSGGACTVNAGDCINGDDALICLNTVCDGNATGGTGESYAGFGCGFASDNDDTGAVNNDPKKQIGAVNAGPWTVTADPTGTNSIIDVTITCTIQVNADTQGAGGVSRTSTTPGNVGVLADSISYFAQPTDSVYLCTVVEWNSTEGGHTTVTDDADNDSSNGYQCALATSTE